MTSIEEWNKQWRHGERADPRWVLNLMRNTRACLADWEIALGPHMPRVRPLLVLCIGQIAASYPTPGSKLRLRVRQREVGYLAHPVGEFDVDAEDLHLTDEEVQLWALDWKKVEAEFGEKVINEQPFAHAQGKSAANSGMMSGRVRAQQVSAGREKAVVTDRRDRAAIRAEVERLMAQGFSQGDACQEVSDQAMKGRVGQHKLTTKYNMPPSVATPTVVRRVYRAKW